MELRKYKLGDIGEVRMCKRILKEETNTISGIPFYKIGTFGNKADVFISLEKFKEYKEKFSYPKKGDILISAAGTIGRTVIYDGSDSYFQDSNIVWIDNDETKVLNKYLFYCYKNIHWFTSKGSTILRLYNDNIRNTEIVVPPLESQKKIVAVLSTLDDKIALNRRMNAKLEQMAKRLYDYWFVQFDFPNADGKPYKASGGKMLWNETLKREIPVGWEVKRLGDIADYVTVSDSAESIRNYISTDNMLPNKAGVIDTISTPTKGNFVRYEKLDILISNIRPYFKKIWFSNQIGNCSTDVLCIRAKKDQDSFFIYRCLWQDDFFDYVMQGAKGSKMPRGDKTRIMNFFFAYPVQKTDIITRYNSLFEPLQKLIWQNEKEIQRLIAMRDRLLPLLMNGQVDII